MKRKHKKRASEVEQKAGSAFLEIATALVTTCAVSGQRQQQETLTRTPYGTVKLTMRAEMLVEAAPGGGRIQVVPS